jgi:CheY-like chemotaxis protein
MPHDPKVIPIMRGRLVLVAERYGTPRVLVTSAVRNLGYPATACSTAADALAFLTLRPDSVQCLLADVGLPDMDGRDLAARALALVPGLRVVLMVAPGHEVQRPIPGFGGLPCVAKPVFRDRLAAMLGDLLGPPAREPTRRSSMRRSRSRQNGLPYPAAGRPSPEIRMRGTVGHRSETTAASCSPSSRGIRMSLRIAPTFVPIVASSEAASSPSSASNTRKPASVRTRVVIWRTMSSSSTTRTTRSGSRWAGEPIRAYAASLRWVWGTAPIYRPRRV